MAEGGTNTVTESDSVAGQPQGAPLRILIVDDDAMVREAYRAFFARSEGFELVGEATNGDEGFEAYARLRPDCVLMDLQMPRASGIQGIQRITARWPDACCIALTTFGGQEYVVAALQAGAAGYLLKDAGAEALQSGIRQAVSGVMPLSPAVRHALVDAVKEAPKVVPDIEAPRLTDRETEVLCLMAEGLSNADIAARSFLSEGSVKQYLNRIGAKVGGTSRTQILIRAIQLGLVDPHAISVDG